jgi:hypothetical protein
VEEAMAQEPTEVRHLWMRKGRFLVRDLREVLAPLLELTGKDFFLSRTGASALAGGACSLVLLAQVPARTSHTVPAYVLVCRSDFACSPWEGRRPRRVRGRAGHPSDA